MSKAPTQKMKSRIIKGVAAIIILGFSAVSFKIGYVVTVNGEDYRRMAVNQQQRDLPISASRGDIYDRNMVALARSASVWNIAVSPIDITPEQKEDVAKALCKLLNLSDEKAVLEKINKKNQYQLIKRKVEKEVADAVMDYANQNNIAGIYRYEDSKRYYPYNDLAASVIGFTDIDGKGLYGVEAKYDEYLQGTPGRVVSIKNSRGKDMPFQYEKLYEAQNGNSVVLTIDQTVQYALERNLDAVIAQYKPSNRACAIAMNVNTGEILGQAVRPGFDLNEPLKITDPVAIAAIEKIRNEEEKAKAVAAEQLKQWRNKAISDNYEPGSVFKIITVSAALQEGAITTGYSFYDTGSIQVLDHTFRCAYRPGHGSQTLFQIMANSCNPALVTIGQKLGSQKFFDYFKSYGYTEKTGIDLPGEAVSASYYTADKLHPVELASSSFGQSISVTPIQMITAVSAAVNGGYLVQPHIVKNVIDQNGAVVKDFSVQPKRQVLSEQTSKIMRDMMEFVVNTKSGANAYVAGYRIAGKSGTAQKLPAELHLGEYVASYVGFAPAENPEIAVLVMVDTPTSGEYYGGVVAAPVVGSIMSEILPYLGVEPKYTAEEIAKLEVAVPSLKGQNTLNAKAKLTALGLEMRIVGSGTKVLSQYPDKPATLPRGSTIVVYTDQNAKPEMVKVPDLIGKTPTEANKALIDAGLNIKLKGGGATQSTAKATVQSIAKDTEVPKGTPVTVEFVVMNVGEEG